MQTTLVILAAGMGSRYGGLKQLDPMGPNGETVLDYSVYDAIEAGFNKVVFVIRRDFEHAFKAKVGTRFEERIEVAYAYQDLNDLPTPYIAPENRLKPWGTAHAVRAAREEVDAPFAVINADDFYGKDAFFQLPRYFQNHQSEPELLSCMIGYRLCQTLSEHGTVNRGLCRVEQGILKSIEEYTEITPLGNNTAAGKNPAGESSTFGRETIVSMNFWGFSPAIFASIESFFTEFIERQGTQAESECYLPSVVDHLIQTEQTSCAVLETTGTWFGVTYPKDKTYVQEGIRRLINKGDYPEKL